MKTRTSRRFFSVVVIVCMAMAVVPVLGALLGAQTSAETVNHAAAEAPAAVSGSGIATGSLSDIELLSASSPSGSSTTVSISTASQLTAFATRVNNGETTLNAKLTANITFSGTNNWTPIGTVARPYSGTFDGQGYTVSGLHVDKKSQTYVGLFGYIGSSGVVKKVGVINSTLKGGTYVGGIAGCNTGDIQNCYSNAAVGISTTSSGGASNASVGGIDPSPITGTVPMASADAAMATGVLGDVGLRLTMSSGDYGGSSSTTYVGGLVGYQTGTVSNCYTSGSVTIFGYLGGKITNCYTLVRPSVPLSTSVDLWVVSDAQLKSGEVTYKLNNSSSSGVWKQTINGSNYPSFSGSTVYYRATVSRTYTYDSNGFQNGYTTGSTIYSYNNTGSSTVYNYTNDQYQQPTLSGSTYQISKPGHLFWFAGLVNGTLSHASKNASASAILTTNITIPSGKTWTPIGDSSNSSVAFKGTFNGNGKTVSGLSVDISMDGCTGLIGHLGTNGMVQNVGVINSNLRDTGYCGAIVGYMTGGTVQKCYSTGCTVYGAETAIVGGIVGHMTGGTVTNCYNTSTVDHGGIVGTMTSGTVTNCYNTGSTAGGIVSYMTGGTVSNCYSTGSLRGNDCGGIVDAKNGGTVSNCYTTANATNGATLVTSAQMSSGEIAYKLNGNSSSGVWKQTINGSNYPSFSGSTVYRKATVSRTYTYDSNGFQSSYTTNSTTYSYNNSSSSTVYNYTNDIYAQPTLSGSTYQISKPGHLFWFAGLVNGTLSHASKNASASAILTTNITIPSGQYWIISDPSFNGTFNGNGHTISNLQYNNSGSCALFYSIGANGTVKNVGLIDSSFGAMDKNAAIAIYLQGGMIENCYSSNVRINGGGACGGIVSIMHSGTINNCYFSGSVQVGETCGGIVGSMTGGTVMNCYSTGTVSTNGLKDGIVGNKSGGTVTNCYAMMTGAYTTVTSEQLASGEIAYKLNGNSSSGVWKQTINGSNYPSFSGSTVYRKATVSRTYTYDSNGFQNGYTTGSTTYSYNNSSSSTVYNYTNDIYAQPTLSGSTYQISKPGHLFWFAGLVNGTLSGVTQNASASAALTANITIPSGKVWTPIGGADLAFTGTFNGNGKTISGLRIPSGDIAGLIGRLKNGKVQLVGLINVDITGSGDVGGIVGLMEGGTVTNCYVTGSITGYSTSAGGIVGFLASGIPATISNCFSTATINGNATHSGSIVGYRSTAGDPVINCYTTQSQKQWIMGDSYAGITLVTDEQMASGEVAYKLGSAFGQKIGTESLPVLGGTVVYEITDVLVCPGVSSTTNISYTNTYREPTAKVHNFVNGTCTVCGASQTVTTDSVKLDGYTLNIGSSVALNFRLAVDSGVNLSTAVAKLTVNNSLHPRTETINLADAQTTVINGKTYYIITANVNAKEMTDKITLEVTAGGRTYTFEYSVKEYADYVIANENLEMYQGSIPLIKAMLTYGAAAQKYFQYNVSWGNGLADAGFDPIDLSYITADSLKSFDIPYASTSVSRLYQVVMNFDTDPVAELYFYENPAYTLTYSYNGKTLSAHKETINAGGADRTMNVVELTGIAPKDWDQNLVITISDGTNSYTVTYNFMTYCYRDLKENNSNATFHELIRAMRHYNLAAKAYFAARNG